MRDMTPDDPTPNAAFISLALETALQTGKGGHGAAEAGASTE
jgi:hypothetical protein